MTISNSEAFVQQKKQEIQQRAINRMGKIFADHFSDKGLISQIYQYLKKNSTTENN